MGSFIAEFMKFTSELEAPSSFFTWAAYTVIAAALRDNVYLTQGPNKTYSNIYTLFLADSGVHRKSQPVRLIYNLLNDIGLTKIMRGRISIQSLLQELSLPVTDKKTGKLIIGGSCCLCADELASFIVQDPQTVPILTDIYDFYPEWRNSLKSDKSVINNLCVTMAAGSNETHLREVYGPLAIRGGLMARTFFIRPDEYRPGNSLFDDLPINGHYDISSLIIELRQISELKGGYVATKDAKIEYDKWYLALREKNKSRPDKTGVYARIHTGVLKVSMILAAGHSYEICIRKEHIDEAITQCTKILPNY